MKHPSLLIPTVSCYYTNRPYLQCVIFVIEILSNAIFCVYSYRIHNIFKHLERQKWGEFKKFKGHFQYYQKENGISRGHGQPQVILFLIFTPILREAFFINQDIIN
ncbi:hypothetical protein DXF93_14065 [Escherichia coli]|nr:hypothetical protein DXF93_14065 [Escherichia coli]